MNQMNFLKIMLFSIPLIFITNSLINSAPVQHYYISEMTDFIQPTQNTTCILCEKLVNIIDHSIEMGNSTIIDLTKLINDICIHIPGPGGKECLMISKDIQYIVEMLTKGLTQMEICEKLHFCN